MVNVTASCFLTAAALILSGAAAGSTPVHLIGHQLDGLPVPPSVHGTPGIVLVQADAGMFSRQTWREAQQALNHFGQDAGTPDGLPGRKTRAAIRGYQASIGETPTGELGRAAMGLLLERYRNALKRSPAPQQSEIQLPAIVSEEVSSIADMCSTNASALLAKPGFVQESDLNGDGVSDYVVDGSASGCMFTCGAQYCTITVFGSNGQSGYTRSDFLGDSANLSQYSCATDGTCRIADEEVQRPPSTATEPSPATGQNAPIAENTAAFGSAPIYERFRNLELPVSRTRNWVFFQFLRTGGIDLFVQNRMLNRPMHDLIYYILTPRAGGGYAIAASNEADPLYVDPQVTHTWTTGLPTIPDGSLVCWQYDPREADFRVFDTVMMVPTPSSPFETIRNFGGISELTRRDPVAPRLTSDRMPCRGLLNGAGLAPPSTSSAEIWHSMIAETEPQVTVVDKLGYMSNPMGFASEPAWMATLQNNSDLVAREMRFAIHSETDSGLNLLATWEPQVGYIDGLEGELAIIESPPPTENITVCVEHLTADGSQRTITIVPMEGAQVSGMGWEFRPRAPSRVGQTDRQNACSDPAYLSQLN
ncbi:MAG: peptidoglycan-binding protein [Hyphomonas sp.]|nr:peptidoglycan-binding protein [Hyphomonas sp.]